MPVPHITTNYSDYNLGLQGAAPRRGKTVYIIGTAADGPMGEPVYVLDPDDARRTFGELGSGTLVRGIDEAFDNPGSKQIYGIRIGNGTRAYIELRETSTWTGIHTPTSSGDYETSVALSIEARYPGSTYNATVIGYDVTEEHGSLIYFYNPKTEATSHFKFNTDTNDNSTNIHNVSDLADAMNADPNIAPFYTVTVNDINASFECWVLPVTSESDYGTVGYGNDWDHFITEGKLPTEWSDGWSYDGYVARFSLSDRIVDTSGAGDADIESPGAARPGWEVLSNGIVSGVGPVKAFETAVNNINVINDLYSLTYTGKISVDVSSPLISMDVKPFNTNGSRGYTVGALNIYKADGLPLKRPNAEPTNEVDPLTEDISTWAGEYSIWVDRHVVTPSGGVGVGSGGDIEFDCFLPPDLSGWPQYWGNKMYPNMTDPVEAIVIGRPFGRYDDTGVHDSAAIGDCWTVDTPVGGEMYTEYYKLNHGEIIDPGYVEGEDIGGGIHAYYFYGATRGGIVSDDGVGEFYKLPPFILAKGKDAAGAAVTRDYPYEDYLQEIDYNFTSDAELPLLYFCVDTPDISDIDAGRLLYSGYFLGPLSLNYGYKSLMYDYTVDDVASTITEKSVLVADKYDISFALRRRPADDEDLNALSWAHQTGATSAGQEFGIYRDPATYENDRLHPSARAIILPVVTDELDGGSWDVTNGSQTVAPTTVGGYTPAAGDYIVFNNRIYRLLTSGAALDVQPFPSVYGEEAPDVDMTGATIVSCSGATDEANAANYAQTLAIERTYKFYENYGTEARPIFEYSLDGTAWFEIEPRYIAAIVWTDNGQNYPNDYVNRNKVKIYFIGSNSMDDPLVGKDDDHPNGLGFYNDPWSVWKALWTSDVATDATLETKYPALDAYFVGIDDTPIVMSTQAYAEFLDWGGDTIPPFMVLSDDGKSLVCNPTTRFRTSYITTKGHLTQSFSKAGVEASKRADYYFVYGNNFLFGASPGNKYVISYLNKLDYIRDVDYTIDSNGVITFTNANKNPFGAEYDKCKRFLLGFDYQYLPEWVDLPANMTLNGGSDGVNIDVGTKYKELSDVLDNIVDYPPEVLLPIDFYVDETIMAYSADTGRPYTKNAGLIDILSVWLDKVNTNAWTTRAVVPILNPTDLSIRGVGNWIERVDVISQTDTLRVANILTQLDNKWIDVVGFPFSYNDSGLTFVTNLQVPYGIALANNTLPELLTGRSIPAVYRPLIQLRGSRVDRLIDSRVNTIIFKESTGYSIADFVTGAAVGSDYSRGLYREIAAELVRRTRFIWDEFSGKVNSGPLYRAFITKLEAELNSVPATMSVQTKFKQTETMRLRGELNLKIDVVPHGEFRHLIIDLALRKQGTT